jgi:hypothetical protein
VTFAAEIERLRADNWRLQERNRRAMTIADTRAIENVALNDAMKWRPIDTAPKDHRIRLLLPSNKEVHGQWSDDRHAKKPRPFWKYEGGGCPRTSNMRTSQPTHWMPIPEAPK